MSGLITFLLLSGGFSAGFLLAVFLILVSPYELFKTLFNKFLERSKAVANYLKERIKRFFKRLGEILLYLVHHINGDIPLEETPIETSSTILPFLKIDETKTPWYEQVAKRLGVHINPNTEVRDIVLEGLERNKEKYGARYCPCENIDYYERKDQPRPATLICPCFAMRTEKDCRCGLFKPECSPIAISHPGKKYITKEDGTMGLVPLDGSEGPSGITFEIQSKIDEANASSLSITASTKEPIPYVYDCIDLHVKEEKKET
jgi:ferredoxin-thioredoxin reductase catalytic chain